MKLSRRINHPADLLSEFDHFFSRAFSQPLVPASRREHSAVGIYEAESAWFLRTDLPGFEKSEVTLKFEDGGLHLRAERDENTHPFVSRIERTFKVPENIDPTAISANLKDGVLEITLPKVEVEQVDGYSIEIN